MRTPVPKCRERKRNLLGTGIEGTRFTMMGKEQAVAGQRGKSIRHDLKTYRQYSETISERGQIHGRPCCSASCRLYCHTSACLADPFAGALPVVGTWQLRRGLFCSSSVSRASIFRQATYLLKDQVQPSSRALRKPRDVEVQRGTSRGFLSSRPGRSCLLILT